MDWPALFSRVSLNQDQTNISALAGGFLTIEPLGSPSENGYTLVETPEFLCKCSIPKLMQKYSKADPSPPPGSLTYSGGAVCGT